MHETLWNSNGRKVATWISTLAAYLHAFLHRRMPRCPFCTALYTLTHRIWMNYRRGQKRADARGAVPIGAAKGGRQAARQASMQGPDGKGVFVAIS